LAINRGCVVPSSKGKEPTPAPPRRGIPLTPPKRGIRNLYNILFGFGLSELGMETIYGKRRNKR